MVKKYELGKPKTDRQKVDLVERVFSDKDFKQYIYEAMFKASKKK